MGLALYRKYRPKGLADVVGQDHIVKTLQSALKSGKISHAYLFTGPRGVGKTSVARILAHEINGLAYTDDSMHLDIIEIDAASNRRIDEIRDLRDKVHVAPTSAKYKVYIIDEVHMLTREAFNALLKTLEEPPSHVVFILATTEAHKVPDTIASRTQRFSFKPINQKDTVDHLRKLAKQEKVSIDEEALEALAIHASGSFRDSINLLDQMVGSGEAIHKADVEAMLGLPDTLTVDSLYTALTASDVAAMARSLNEARIGGTNAGTLALAVGERIRNGILQGNSADTATVLLLRQLISAAGERDAFTALELALFEFAALPTAPRSVPNTSGVVAVPSKPTKVNVAPIAKTPSRVAEESLPVEVPTDAIMPVTATMNATDESFWKELLAVIKKNHNTDYSVLRMAKPHLEGDKLALVFSFPFHQKRMSEAPIQKRIADAASELLGRSIAVQSLYEKDVKIPPIQAAKVTRKETSAPIESTSLKDVSAVFEGAELVD